MYSKLVYYEMFDEIKVKPMTIIIGILCKEGLIIGSDSQASSFRGVEVKRSDYTKITQFSEGDFNIVVSGAGLGAFISKFIDKLQEKCKTMRIEGMNQLSDMAEDIMTDIQKRYMVEKAEKLGFTKKTKIQEPLTKLQLPEIPQFAIMLGIARSKGEDPTIYTITPYAVAERAEKFDSTGSGSAYAEYLLAKLYRDDMTMNQTISLAVYVIEEVKKIDPNCGGATQIVVLDKRGMRRLQDLEIKKIVEETCEIENCANKVWWSLADGNRKCEEIEGFINPK
jgi:20S proteasome alpha/beta subunit